MLLNNLDGVGRKHASRIWGFISKFVMVDRFFKTLGVALVYPGTPFVRQAAPQDFGPAGRVSNLKLKI
jgi:hypothetical protein